MGLFSRRGPSVRQPFGFKTAWIAVQSDDDEGVAGALRLSGVRRRRWDEGLAAATEAGVFVCPPVDGWTLAVGNDLLLNHPIDIATLSTTLRTEAQLFASHRVVDAYSWSMARNGVLVRTFEYVGDQGEIVRNVGALTTAEHDSPAAEFFSLPEGPDESEIETWPDEGTVLGIAAAWSIDPSALAGPDDRKGRLGRLA